MIAGAAAAAVIQTAKNPVETDAVDELHHVVVIAVLFAHAEHRHDVRVVQPGGRLRLALKTLHAAGVGQQPLGQQLYRHASPQRLLLRFIHHAHSAAADFANQPEVAQAPRLRPLGRRRRRAFDLDAFQCGDCGEQVANSARPLRISRGVLVDGRPLADAVALGEFAGQDFDRIAAGAFVNHGEDQMECAIADVCGEARNPKHEFRNKFKNEMIERRKRGCAAANERRGGLRHSVIPPFEFVSDFDIRISNFLKTPATAPKRF